MPSTTRQLLDLFSLALLVSCTRAMPYSPVESPNTKLHICMISAYREHAYVQRTSDALNSQLAQLPLPTRSRVTFDITVAAASLDDVPIASPLATLMKNRQIASGPDCVMMEDTDPLPPCKVRQQGLDVANALEACYHEHQHAAWIVLLEDDFEPCEHGLLGLIQTLDTLTPEGYKYVRFTQGGGGVAFPISSVTPYVASVRENIKTSPHDRALLLPWSSKPDYVFPVHFFMHIGKISTLEYRNSPAYQQAYAGLRDNTCGSAIAV